MPESYVERKRQVNTITEKAILELAHNEPLDLRGDVVEQLYRINHMSDMHAIHKIQDQRNPGFDHESRKKFMAKNDIKRKKIKHIQFPQSGEFRLAKIDTNTSIWVETYAAYETLSIQRNFIQNAIHFERESNLTGFSIFVNDVVSFSEKNAVEVGFLHPNKKVDEFMDHFFSCYVHLAKLIINETSQSKYLQDGIGLQAAILSPVFYIIHPYFDANNGTFMHWLKLQVQRQESDISFPFIKDFDLNIRVDNPFRANSYYLRGNLMFSFDVPVVSINANNMKKVKYIFYKSYLSTEEGISFAKNFFQYLVQAFSKNHSALKVKSEYLKIFHMSIDKREYHARLNAMIDFYLNSIISASSMGEVFANLDRKVKLGSIGTEDYIGVMSTEFNSWIKPKSLE